MTGLLRRRRAGGSLPRPCRVPPGLVVTAVGDVHGRLDLLGPVLAAVEREAAARPELRHVLVMLGDLVDRGPDSAGVVDRLADGLAGVALVLLRGNHEDMMLRWLDGRPGGQAWLANGGDETLASYGVRLDSPAEALRALPRAHLKLLRGLALSHTIGDYFFVHAGARPGVPLERQAEHDLLWIRDEFHRDRMGFDKRIVHGHTPVPEPEWLDTRINLDTGAVWTGRLSAAWFEDGRAGLLER